MKFEITREALDEATGELRRGGSAHKVLLRFLNSIEQAAVARGHFTAEERTELDLDKGRQGTDHA